MGELESAALLTQFTSSNRSGRRNAVAEIDVDAVDPTAEKLASRFAQMGNEQERPGTSSKENQEQAGQGSSSSSQSSQ